MAGKAQSILIVDGDRTVASDLQQTLTSLGYDAYAIASSAEEALSLASRRCPDLALVDVGIKGPVDGMATAEMLHGRHGVPVVFLTDRDVIIEKAGIAEPYRYLLKPVRRVELRSVIELTLQRHQAEKPLREIKEVSSPPSVAVSAERHRPESVQPDGRRGRRTTVLLADDHAMLREGLEKLLTEHGFDVVGAVANGDQLLEVARRRRPDVIVTDISMPPGLSGLEVLARLKAEHLDSKIIVLTMHNDAELATRAARAGVSGFLLKLSAGEELVTAIHQALQGQVYFAAEVTKGVMERLTAPSGPAEPTLTARQLDVLRLIVEGRRMKEIAEALGLSTRTVETHKYQMMGVLGVTSTAELVRYAIEHRLFGE